MSAFASAAVKRAQVGCPKLRSRNVPALIRRCATSTCSPPLPRLQLLRLRPSSGTRLSASGRKGESSAGHEDDNNLPESLEEFEQAYEEDELEEEAYGNEEGLGEPSSTDADLDGSPDYPVPQNRSWYLPDLFAMSGFLEVADELDTVHHEVEVHGVQNIAEKVEEGDLYFAVESLEYSGHDHVMDAIQNKAAAVILQTEIEGLPPGTPVLFVDDVENIQAQVTAAFYEHPSLNTTMVGVTGSAGKTTVCWLLRGIMEEMGKLTGLVGSLEHAIGEDLLTEDGELWYPTEEDSSLALDSSTPFHLSPWKGKYEVKSTTPDSLHMQKLLAGMVDRGAEAAVVECEPGAAADGSLDAVDLDVLVVTNCIAPLGVGDDEEAHQADKDAMLGLLGRLHDKERQRAVINLDDPSAQEMIAAAKVPVVTFSLRDASADVFAQRLEMETTESELIVRTPVGRVQIITPLIGRHNASNVLAAVAAGVAMSLPLTSINAGIEAVEVVPGRCELLDEGQSFQVLVDAASTPEQLASLMASVRDCRPEGRIFLLVGVDGTAPRAMRPHVGDIAHRLADVVILTNSSPVLDEPGSIIKDVVAGFPEEVLNLGGNMAYWPLQDQGRVPLWFEPYLQYTQRYVRRYVYEDRCLAIRCAIGTGQPGDFIIIAGRGACDYVEHWSGASDSSDVIRGWFDDRVEARNALSKLSILDGLELGQRYELPWSNTIDKGLQDKPHGIILEAL